MRTGFRVLLVAVLATGATVAGQAQTGQSAQAGRQRYVAIGCVARQGTATAPRYALSDARGTSPTVYRLSGDVALFEQHVGHTVEASGTIAPSTAASRTPSAQPTLRVESLVWLSTTCQK